MLQTPSENKKKTNFFIGLLLLVVAILLSIITCPIGFVYGILRKLFSKGFRGLGDYFLKIAISIDQTGNVVMQHLLNDVWIKKNSTHKFGNRDETISSVLGKNELDNTLTFSGTVIKNILNFLDKDHAFNSIDHYVEPED